MLNVMQVGNNFPVRPSCLIQPLRFVMLDVIYVLLMLTAPCLFSIERPNRVLSCYTATEHFVNFMQVFFVRDGMKFPDMVHALKPNPKNHIQEGWRIMDFFSHHPAAMHMVRFLSPHLTYSFSASKPLTFQTLCRTCYVHLLMLCCQMQWRPLCPLM